MNYVNSHNTELWNFDVFPDVLQNSLFLNPNRIHPLKQREVSHLVQLAVTDPKINQIIVFGSTTEFRCSSYSDIDLFIEREDEQCIVPDEFYDSNSELDIHYSKNLGGVTVPNTHQIRKLLNMSRNNGSAAVITQWVEEHCGEITEWEANTRYNFDYYLELNFLKEAIKEIEIFLEKNGLTEQLDIRITEDVKRKILQRMPSEAAPKSNLEWNVYYRVFSKK